MQFKRWLLLVEGAMIKSPFCVFAMESWLYSFGMYMSLLGFGHFKKPNKILQTISECIRFVWNLYLGKGMDAYS